MILTNTEKRFIRNTIQFIENNDFNKFFDLAETSHISVGVLAWWLQTEASIDVLTWLDGITWPGFFDEWEGDLVIPSNIQIIGENVAWGSVYINKLTIVNAKTILQPNSFKGSSVKTIVLPEGLKTIPADAFADCVKLESVQIPSSVKKIEAGAFRNTKVRSVMLSSKAKYMDTSFDDTTIIMTER